MRFFITGCNGLVGSYIARKLLAEGAEVSALKREQSSFEYIQDIADKIAWHHGDILDVMSLEQPILEADFVIHCAGFVSFASKDYSKMFKVNVEGTANLVNGCLKYGQKKLLYISSVAALGTNDRQEVIDETQEWDDANISSKYGYTKFMGESEVWRGHSEGLDVIVVNPSVVFGRGEWGRSSLALIKYAASSPIFYPTGDVNYIDARDLADIIFQLIDRKIYNKRFIASAGKESYYRVMEIVSKEMGTKAPSLKFNKTAAFIALQTAKLMAFFKGILQTGNQKREIQPKLSKELIKNSTRKTFFDNKKIVETLDFKFRKLEDTLTWLVSKN